MRDNIFGTDARNDTFGATETIRETFYGLGGDDIFLFYEGISTDFDPDFSDRFIGGAGNDLMAKLNIGLQDYSKFALLSFDGGKGYDSVRYWASGEILDEADILMDLGRFQTLERSVERHEFETTVTVGTDATGDFSVTGSNIDETFRLSMESQTGAAVVDVMNVTVRLGGGNDQFEFVGDWDVQTSLLVDTGAGNDAILINDSTVRNSDVRGSRINAGTGNDLVVLEGMNKEFVRLGNGNDTVAVLSGGFADVPDTITTGSGRDRIYLELDEYSTLARITDFDAARDRIVFDADEFRDTTVTFSKKVANTATEPMLYMNNKADKLFFGDNLLATFTTDVELTAANFDTDIFLF